ncbi:MAG TPA: hypothetical protein VFY44_03350, partial [Thermoleophilaceae bacterium]|nr:hypothetical protein [Thermoleophilaceae bacterium]
MAAALLLTALCLAGRGDAQPPPTPEFTDWTTATDTKVDGTLQGAAMSLTGEIGPSTVTNGSETGFNNSAFTPPLATSDSLQVRTATAGNPYTFVFTQPVTNPVIHIGDLSGTVSFNPSVRLSRVSGDAGFTVSGSTVTGTGGANGTVVPIDTYTGLAFTATSNPADVFYLQLGAFPGAVGRPAPPPDFRVQRGSGGQVVVAPGASTRVPVEVARNSPSSGPINLSSLAQGTGVTTRMEPTQVNGRDLERATLVVMAAKSAKPGIRTVTVRGSPGAAGAGPTSRTVQ